MASGEARQMKKNNPDAKIIVGNGIDEIWSEVFENNPHISRLEDVNPCEKVIWLKNYVNNRPYLDYKNSNADFPDHLLARINESNGCQATLTFDKKAGLQPPFQLLR